MIESYCSTDRKFTESVPGSETYVKIVNGIIMKHKCAECGMEKSQLFKSIMNVDDLIDHDNEYENDSDENYSDENYSDEDEDEDEQENDPTDNMKSTLEKLKKQMQLKNRNI